MERSSLQDTVDRTAHAMMRTVGITPTSEFEAEMARAMDTALDRMEEEGALQDEEKVRQAEANTAVLMTAVVEEARETASATADASVFRRALRRVCPLYPFC
jgi:hypothetical protein